MEKRKKFLIVIGIIICFLFAYGVLFTDVDSLEGIRWKPSDPDGYKVNEVDRNDTLIIDNEDCPDCEIK